MSAVYVDVLKLNREGPCSFCGRPMGWYESKRVEVGGEGRICCNGHIEGDKFVHGCDVRDFAGLPAEVKSKFHRYSDG